MVIGRQPVIEAIRSGKMLERIFLLRQAKGDPITRIRELAAEHRIPISLVPDARLDAMSRGNHQGCIALAGLVSYLDLQDLISFVQEQGRTPLFLMVDGVTDVRNIGAIARSAVCCGADALILPQKGVAALNEEAIKASAGALEHLQVCRVEGLVEAARTLHLNGIRILAAEKSSGPALYDCPLKDPLAVILGSEQLGIQAALLKISDGLFHIPMAGDFDSFNVSVAAGIILYEIQKQRGSAGPLS